MRQTVTGKPTNTIHSARVSFHLSRKLTLAAIILASGLICYGVLTFRMADFEQPQYSGEDMRCYRGIVEKIHSGEGYYRAAYAELQSRGYPTGSVFNWRMPFLAMWIGQLPDPEIARVIAILLSLFSLWLWIDVSVKTLSIPRIAAGAIPSVGLTLYSVIGIVFFMHELWAGILISMSLFAYGKGWRTLSLTSGILSLFIRELAMPFVAIMFISSLIERKRGEAAIWLFGIVAFCVALFLHSLQVNEFIKNSGSLDFSQWFAFGGWNFVLATIHTQPFLIVCPPWFTAILAPTALIGFLRWRGPLGVRAGLTVMTYVLSFLIIGKSINAYWGLTYCNLVPLGLLYIPDVYRSLQSEMPGETPWGIEQA
jgi:hypothetical protein